MISKGKNYSVYKHIFPNNKVYIGITCKKPIYRWNNGNGYKKECNKYMYNAINKYGWNNIKHEILFENLTKEDAEEKEIELIAFYKSCERKFGYNLKSGGSCGRHCEMTKNKISKHSKGKILSKETKNKISKSLKLLYKDGVPSRRKKVIQLNKNLIEIKNYESIAQASLETNIQQSNISACCRNKRKMAGGYIWQFQKQG